MLKKKGNQQKQLELFRNNLCNVYIWMFPQCVVTSGYIAVLAIGPMTRRNDKALFELQLVEMICEWSNMTTKEINLKHSLIGWNNKKKLVLSNNSTNWSGTLLKWFIGVHEKGLFVSDKVQHGANIVSGSWNMNNKTHLYGYILIK